MSDESVSQTDDDWAFDEECPECGEDTYLAAIVEKMEDGDPVRAELMCGERYYNTDVSALLTGGDDEQGCGHEWEWVADE